MILPKTTNHLSTYFPRYNMMYAVGNKHSQSPAEMIQQEDMQGSKEEDVFQLSNSVT